MRHLRCTGLQLLLLVLAASSTQQQGWRSPLLSAAAAAAAPAEPLITAASVVDLPPELQAQLVDEVTAAAAGPIYRKPANISKASADAASPQWVSMQYRDPGQGPCGQWDSAGC